MQGWVIKSSLCYASESPFLGHTQGSATGLECAQHVSVTPKLYYDFAVWLS